MAARVLDGMAVANAIRAELRRPSQAFTARAGRPPGLGIVLVGDDPASEIYVRSKLKSGGETGLRADLERLPATATLEELLAVVDRLNRSEAHDGILVQSPLPAAMGADAERHVFDAIAPDKDVDGFHPVNVGRLVQNRAALVPCTPSGVIELLERSGIADRRRARRGHRPQRHRRQADGAAAAAPPRDGDHLSFADGRSAARWRAEADILVAAIGRPGFVTPDVRQAGRCGGRRRHHAGHRSRDWSSGCFRRTRSAARRSSGADRSSSATSIRRSPSVAGALSPVPGGVGPLTIAMLLKNTVTAAVERAGWAG